MEIRSFWLALQIRQKLPLMCSLNIVSKYSKTPFQSLMRKTCELTKCLPPSGGEMVHRFSSRWLSLQEVPGIRGMSHCPTQMPIPVAGTRGFEPHSRPEGLYFSTGLLQSWAPFALEINVNQQKFQEKVKYQQQKRLLCTSLSPLCFCLVTRNSEENGASKGWREKNWRSAELESWKGAKFQIRKDASNLLCRNIECHLRKGSRLPPQRPNWRSSIP